MLFEGRGRWAVFPQMISRNRVVRDGASKDYRIYPNKRRGAF